MAINCMSICNVPFIDEIYPLIIAVRRVYVHSPYMSIVHLCLTTTIRIPITWPNGGACLAVHLMLGSIWKRPVRNCRKQLRLAWRREAGSQSTSQQKPENHREMCGKSCGFLSFLWQENGDNKPIYMYILL